VNLVKVGVGEAEANAVDRVEVIKNGVVKLRRKIQQGMILGRLWLSLRNWLVVHNRV
jgi:hypothetical protein